MKIKNLLAAACALCLAVPIHAYPVKHDTECFLRNKKEENKETEETVLDENITPRRGNGPDSYYQRNPAKEERRKPPHPKQEQSESAPPESESGNTVTTATQTTAYNWYCPHRKDGKAPDIPSEMSFIEKHGGYFLNHAAKDDDKVIYLTFDAGYENGNIEKILDTLKAEHVPGAFFVLENLIKTNTDLVKRMAEEGHLVCNHTAKHHDMSKVTDKAAFESELEKLEQIYQEYTGHDMAKYYRPPEGKFSELNLIHAEELGYKTIFWSFAYADWDNEKQMPREKAMEKILTGTHNGEVLLLHPTSATNAEILPDLIREWKKMGYRFGTLDELVSEP